MNWKSVFAFGSFVGVAASAIGAAPGQANLADDERGKTRVAPGRNVTSQSGPINQRFRTLDEYLAFLERTQGPVDGPWYKKVGPGMFELQTGNLRLDVPGGQKRRFTRDELEKKFGFSR